MENDTVSILQANLQKSKVSTSELNHWSYDIALVQEPNVGAPGRVGLVEAPKKVYCKGQARAAIIIKENIDFWPVESLTNRDLAAVVVRIRNNELMLLHTYTESPEKPMLC